jgi:hypothetical protein
LAVPNYDQGTSGSATLDASGFCNNKVIGYSELGLTDSDTTFGFYMRCDTMRAMEIQNNQFYVAKNYTYTSASPSSTSDIVRMEVDDASNLAVNGNTVHAFRNITEGSTGKFYSGVFLTIYAQAGVGNIGGDLYNTKIENNNLGLPGCRLRTLSSGYHRHSQTSVSRNTLYRNSGETYQSDITLQPKASSVNYGIVFDGNTTLIGDEVGSAYTANAIHMSVAATVTIHGLQITNNQWTVQGDGWTAAAGISITNAAATINGLLIKGNTALMYESPDDEDTNFNVLISASATVTSESALPADGAWFGDNFNLRRVD